MEKKEVFIKAIQKNQRLIYKVASFYIEGKDDREDLVQEIIYSLWKSFETFKGNSSLSTWMYRVAMNVTISHVKKRKQRVSTISADLGSLNIPDQERDDFEEKLQTLHMHIKDLNLLDKGILMLYLESKSHDEIAEIVGISKSNVGTKLSRIKDKLRKQISKQTNIER